MELQKYIKVINDTVVNSIPKFKNKSAVLIADAILYKPKYKHYLSDYPMYDSSGEIEKDGHFTLSDYSSLEDFLDEYTGEREASFCSGCGWFYTTYEDKLEELAEEFINDIALDICNEVAHKDKEFVLKIINSEDSDDLGGDLLSYIYEEWEYCDNLITRYELLEFIKEIPLDAIYREGLLQAKINKRAAIEKEEKRMLKINAYREKANQLSTKLKTLIETAYPEYSECLLRLDKPKFKSIIGLLKNNFTEEEIAILGRFVFICSNSVQKEFEKIYSLGL